jgi:muconolactone delta-isomerase
MLFLIISTPAVQRPSDVLLQRRKFWPWAQTQLDKGLAREFYARTGRGGVAIFDVDSNDTLHRLLNEWADIMPATFEIYPLLDTTQIKAFLGNNE